VAGSLPLLPNNRQAGAIRDGEVPLELERAADLFASRAIEKVIVALAKREFAGLHRVDYTWFTTGERELAVSIGSKVFYLLFNIFNLGKKSWSWKITLGREESLAHFRQPTAQHPVETLFKAAEGFGLLLL
jgi:hypothetical protein